MIREHAIWSSAFSHARLSDTRPAQVDELRDPLGFYSHPHGCIALATVLGTPVGFATMSYRHGALLTRCHVNAAYRRLGLGTELARVLLGHAASRDERFVSLHVPRRARPVASAMLAALGIRPPGRYPKNGEIHIDLSRHRAITRRRL
jgi:ribosomal protein S18 acetylase RimI-like enzyme